MTTPTLPRSVWEHAATTPNRDAVIDPDGSVVSFASVASASNRIARAFRRLGVDRGDVVAALLPNSHTVFEMFAACMQIGVYFTPLNFHLTAAELGYILSDSGAKLFVADASFADVASAAAQSAAMKPDRCLSIGLIPGFSSLIDAMATESEDAPAGRTAGHRLLYTSGTTGRPKGVLKALPTAGPDEHTNANSLRVFGNSHLPTEPGKVHLVAGPTYHGAPIGHGMAALHLGQTVVLMARWTPEQTLDLIERHRVNSAHFVPTMFHRMLALPDEARRAADVSSLEAVVHAAAPCPPDVKRRMIEWWGPIVHEYYSSSEGGGTSVTASEWMQRPGTVGRPAPGAEIRILDDDGVELPIGTAGLVHFKMREPFQYLGDPGKSAASRHGDWFTVGDIGYVDDAGYLYLCDRQADTIISGGVNIYPAEIEAVLLTHPGVAEAAVIGVPDEEWGEQVKAVVQLRTGYSGPSVTAELGVMCAEVLAQFKRPRSFDIVGELPRDTNGKLPRRQLRQTYWKGRDRAI